MIAGIFSGVGIFLLFFIGILILKSDIEVGPEERVINKIKKNFKKIFFFKLNDKELRKSWWEAQREFKVWSLFDQIQILSVGEKKNSEKFPTFFF